MRVIILKHIFVPLPGITCPEQPPSLDNGDYTLSSSNIVGSIATYTCNEGYRFDTTATSRMCQSNEMWTTENIQCEKGWENLYLYEVINIISFTFSCA